MKISTKGNSVAALTAFEVQPAPGRRHRPMAVIAQRAIRIWRPLALCLSLLVLPAMAALWHRQSVEVGATADAARKAEEELRRDRIAFADVLPTMEFTEQFPASSATDAAVRHLQRSSTELGASFVSVVSTPHLANQQSLARTDLSVTLRGSYPNLRAVLAECLDRFPNLVLQRLSLRRLASPNDVEARLELTWLSRPQSASSPVR